MLFLVKQILDFTVPLFTDYYYLFMTKPKKSISLTTFTDVFNVEFWIAIAAFAGILSVVVYLFFKCSQVGPNMF